MIELLQNQAFTMALAGLGGWMLKNKALENQRRADQFAMALESNRLSTTSADAAAARSNSEFGKWTSRLLAFAVALAVIGLCYVSGFFEKSSYLPAVKEGFDIGFGLFKTGSKPVLQEVPGFVHKPELWTGFGHIVSFYFGQRAAKP